MSDTIEQAQPADITVSTPLVHSASVNEQSTISAPAISANHSASVNQHKQDRLKTISELTHQELVEALRRMKPDDTDEYVYKLSKSGQWRRYKKPSEEQQELNKQRLQKASQIRLQNQQAKRFTERSAKQQKQQSTIAREWSETKSTEHQLQKDPSQNDQLQTLIEDIKQLKEQYIKSNTQAVFTQQIIRSRSQSILPEIQEHPTSTEPQPQPSRPLRNPNLLRFMK